jgi:two-component system, NtrC family, nitrogen regulation sensor histidine kinase NtrY
MSFRTRLFLGILLGVLIPLGVAAYGVRREMERRLTREYEERVASLASVIEADLSRQSAGIDGRLRSLAGDLARDNRFRLALRGEPRARRYLLDYAGEAMRLSGLSMLQIQDSGGRILSSGHFRNEFDQVQPDLAALLRNAPGIALVRTRTAEAPLLALARADSFSVGGARFSIAAGITAGSGLLDSLARGADLSVSLEYGGLERPPAPGSRVLREIDLPYVDLLSEAATLDTARLVINQSLNTLEALRRSSNRWFLLALGLTGAMALALAGWLSSTISQPLRELARKTSEVDLDRLDQNFDSDGRDEIGALSRLLGEMTERLRSSSARLREVERRAAVGDLARQVNHDIKNGLAPIRNVLRHLAQVGRQDPHLLPSVFEDRRSTLESSVEYLETLSRNYARLSPGLDRRGCNVNAIVNEVLRNTTSDGTQLRSELEERLPPVLGDDLMLRRILENLIGNAVESLTGKPGGLVTVSTEHISGTHPERVRITVADTGPGMTRAQLDRAFDDFYTTKPGGTGLGLSIVRRLIQDLDGAVRIETKPGAGTRVVLELPVATGQTASAV